MGWIMQWGAGLRAGEKLCQKVGDGVTISEPKPRMRKLSVEKNLCCAIFSAMHVCKYVNIGPSLPPPPFTYKNH